jgi:5-methylcytosine-specific restriction endonuclease McrA
MNKKQKRDNFRNKVFARDKHQCVMCKKKGCKLDAHHIVDRTEINDGGYLLENGITLCAGDDQDNCHWKAEQFHCMGVAHPGYSQDDLFGKIGSSLEQAIAASE